MKFKNKIQYSIAFKRARNKHTPILEKMINKTLKQLRNSTNWVEVNHIIEQGSLGWIEHCERFSSKEYIFNPEPNSFIDNLIKYL